MNQDEDNTGLCTVRDLARMMIAGPRINGECVGEMWFMLDGKQVNIEFAVTLVDGVRLARSWQPEPGLWRKIKRAWLGFTP